MSEHAPGQIPLFGELLPQSDKPEAWLHPRTGKPLDRKSIDCKQKNRHHLEPCPWPGCSGILESKSPRGNEHRYACDTKFPGAAKKHWSYYINDEVLKPPQRDHNRNRKLEGLRCPACDSDEYDFFNAAKDGQIQKYCCRNTKCSETFEVRFKADGAPYVHRRSKIEPQNTAPPCPKCSSRRQNPVKGTLRHVSPSELAEKRLCKDCGHGWEQFYDARLSDDTRRCAYCQGPITSSNRRAKFCSAAHQRQAQEAARRQRIRSERQALTK